MTPLWPMLANRDLQGVQPISWHRLQEQWNLSTEGLMPVAPIVIAALLLGGVMVIVSGWRSGKLFGLRSAPRRIYRQVIGDFGFTHSEKRLLVRIARQQQLPTPLTLLLSATTFEHHVGDYARATDPRPRAKFDARVERVREIIFGVTGKGNVHRRLL